MSIAGELARFVTSTGVNDLPPLALERARMVIASTIASAAMGADIVSSRIIRELARERGGTARRRPIWFDGRRKLPVADAARVNAVMSDAAASDDSDLRSIAHIGTIVSTTAIAMAERTGAGGRDVLRAMVLGYEIAGRVDEALTPGRLERGFHGSISTIFGGAVAAGTLLALTRRADDAGDRARRHLDRRHARRRQYQRRARVPRRTLGDAGHQRRARRAARDSSPKSDVLEMPRGFFSAYGGDHLEDVTKDLGREWDITTNMAIKLVPGGHPHHAAAEAAANAAVAGNVNPADVASIMVSAPKYRTLPGPKHPTDLIGVAHSPAYFIAAAIADKGYGWIHASPEKVADPVIAQLIDKIVTDPNPQPYPDRFPHHHGATDHDHAQGRARVLESRRLPARIRAARDRMGRRGREVPDGSVPLSEVGAGKIEASLKSCTSSRRSKSMSELTQLLS